MNCKDSFSPRTRIGTFWDTEMRAPKRSITHGASIRGRRTLFATMLLLSAAPRDGPQGPKTEPLGRSDRDDHTAQPGRSGPTCSHFEKDIACQVQSPQKIRCSTIEERRSPPGVAKRRFDPTIAHTRAYRPHDRSYTVSGCPDPLGPFLQHGSLEAAKTSTVVCAICERSSASGAPWNGIHPCRMFSHPL